MRIEETIFKHLIYNEEYTRKVLPFLKEDYFYNKADKVIFEEISTYIQKYNNNPTYESLIIILNEKDLSEDIFSESLEILNDIQSTKNELDKIEWLIDITEKFCKDKAIYNGIKESITILEGKSKQFDKGSIPDILTKALAVGFDTNIGHDFIENYNDRYEYYHRVEEKVAFDLEYFNKITKGGFSKKTLNLFIGGPHSGKSLIKCHLAASYILQGKNVLFISLEMSEEEIAKRIDSNIMNMSINAIEKMSYDEYKNRIERLANKKIGKLIIKQFQTGIGNVFHFEHLINELNLKKNFKPDAVIVDYLGICGSIRYKGNASVGSYQYVKAISEELRGLAIKYNIPIISSSQFNRGGSSSTDPGMGDVSDSFGINMTGDFIAAIISTPELIELNQYLIKQIKNRYRDMNLDNKFIIGVNREKMQLYDVEKAAQQELLNEGQVIQTPKKKDNFDTFKF